MTKIEFINKLKLEIFYDENGFAEDRVSTLAEKMMVILGYPQLMRCALNDYLSDILAEMTPIGEAQKDAELLAEWVENNLVSNW